MKSEVVEFKADSSQNWQKFQGELVPGAFSKQKEADELVAISGLLNFFHERGALDFPLRLVYAVDTAIKPDFQLYLSSRHIAIEVTQLTAEALRAVQNNPAEWPKNCSVIDTTQLTHGRQPKSFRKRLDKACLTPNFLDTPADNAQRDSWLSQFAQAVQRKSKIEQENSFESGDEDWLLIWDRLPTPFDIQIRAAGVEETLHLLEPPCTFNQVYILDECSQWLIGARRSNVGWETQVF